MASPEAHETLVCVQALNNILDSEAPFLWKCVRESRPDVQPIAVQC
jgi:hypothetical protein